MKARKSFAGADCFPDGAVWIWGHFLSDCPGKYFSADSVGGHSDLRRFFDDLYKPGSAGSGGRCYVWISGRSRGALWGRDAAEDVYKRQGADNFQADGTAEKEKKAK